MQDLVNEGKRGDEKKMIGKLISRAVGVLKWIGEVSHDRFFVADAHPMTEKEYDRWQSGQTLAAFPGRVHSRIREERQHRELLEAIERSRNR
jgi:hypothetical protein